MTGQWSGGSSGAGKKFSGAFYQDQDGMSIHAAGGQDTVVFIAGDMVYDTDAYLQAGFLKAPFDGYYRVTAMVFFDQLVAADYTLTPIVDSTSLTVSGRGDATNGINASCSQTFHLAAGLAMAVSVANYDVADQIVHGWLQVEYLGPS